MNPSPLNEHRSSISSSPISSVELLTTDIDRAVAFYHHDVGFVQRDREDGSVAFSARVDGPELIVLRENRQASARPRGSAGLYHIAIRVPSREELGRLLYRLHAAGVRLQGGADHGVSEALYLADNDGNGIELYVDRPSEQWEHDGDQLAMTTEALDEAGLLSAVGMHPKIDSPIHPQTVIGHVHLQVTSLPSAERFYASVLGMAVTQRSFPGALFLSYDGYHHHIGLNIWHSQNGGPAAIDRIGLRRISIALPGDRFHRVLEEAQRAGIHIVESSASELILYDPDGIEIHIMSANSFTHQSTTHRIYHA